MPGAADGDGIKLALDSLHAEARKWRRLSSDMAAVKADVGRLSLPPNAFFFADIVSVVGHSSSYNTFHEWYTQLLTEATSEFREIGAALDKSAVAYADADTRADVDLRSIYGTRPEGR